MGLLAHALVGQLDRQDKASSNIELVEFEQHTFGLFKHALVWELQASHVRISSKAFMTTLLKQFNEEFLH
jgi:hypothetical protein